MSFECYLVLLLDNIWLRFVIDLTGIVGFVLTCVTAVRTKKVGKAISDIKANEKNNSFYPKKILQFRTTLQGVYEENYQLLQSESHTLIPKNSISGLIRVNEGIYILRESISDRYQWFNIYSGYSKWNKMRALKKQIKNLENKLNKDTFTLSDLEALNKAILPLITTIEKEISNDEQ